MWGTSRSCDNVGVACGGTSRSCDNGVWHVGTSRSCYNVGVAHGKEIRMHSVHGIVEMVRGV